MRQVGCSWPDRPPDYGPSTTVYNRFDRGSHSGVRARLFATPSAQAELPEDIGIDRTAVPARGAAGGGRRLRKLRPSGARVVVKPSKSPQQQMVAGAGSASAPAPAPFADIPVAPALLGKVPASPRLLADRGCDVNSLRDLFRASKTDVVI